MRDIEATLENDSFERYFAEEVTLGTELEGTTDSCYYRISEWICQ